MKVYVLLPFLVSLSEGIRSQDSLPDMPGPPYPDKYGNNRWGVKYNPEENDSSTEGEHDYSSFYSPSRSSPPWAAALRPFIGGRPRLSKTFKRNHRRNDNGYYTLRKHIRKPKVNTGSSEETTSELPISISEIYASAVTTNPSNQVRYSTLNPQNSFFQPKATEKKGAFAKTLSAIYNDYKPSEMVTSAISAFTGSRGASDEDDSRGKPSKGKVQATAATETGDEDDYPPAFSRRPAPSSSSSSGYRSSSSRAPSYRERERPSYDEGNSISSSSASYKRPRGPPPSSLSTRPLSQLDMYEDAPYISSGGGSGSPYTSSSSSGGGGGGSSYSGSGPFNEYSNSPAIVSGTRGSSGYSSGGSPYEYEGVSSYPGPGSSSFSRPSSYSGGSSPYSGSPSYSGPSSYSGPPSYSGPSSYSGSPSPGGPLRVTSYSMGGPPSSSFEGYSSSPYSSPSSGGPPSSSPHYAPQTFGIGSASGSSPVSPISLSISSPLASVGYLPPPGVYIPPNGYYPTPTPSKEPVMHEKPFKKLKRKRKKQSVHAFVRDMMLGRKERRPPPHFHEEESEAKTKTVAPPPSNPFVVMPPPVTVVASSPQLSYNPLLNSIPGAISPLALGAGRFPSTLGYPPFTPIPRAPGAVSQLAQSISTLRDAITGYREPRPPRYYYPPPPPPPPRPRPTQYTSSSGDGPSDRDRDNQKEGSGPPPRAGPVTQHLQDWPRIFTAMGSSVDAVAGGIHAVRKEISKMTGQTIAKGIMMGGSTAQEVSKGLAHMVAKISAI